MTPTAALRPPTASRLASFASVSESLPQSLPQFPALGSAPCVGSHGASDFPENPVGLLAPPAVLLSPQTVHSQGRAASALLPERSGPTEAGVMSAAAFPQESLPLESFDLPEFVPFGSERDLLHPK